ncbi:MAG TPA: hypothetical protein VMY78_14195 [Solirubrobacteraceae bacterium]|nr:hypothetical protein [Solirubrobacteraceae bacterium]
MLGTEDPALHRVSVEDVYRMVDAGILGEDEHVELIDGVLTAKAWRYARAGVGESRLVDVARRSVMVHQAPGAEGYRRVDVYGDGAVVPAPAGAPPVALGELLGPE